MSSVICILFIMILNEAFSNYVSIDDSILLPYDRYERGNPIIIATHGLGAPHTQYMSHINDKFMTEAISHAAELANISYIGYTARGHGKSSGWERTAKSDPLQFTWERLADDTIHISKYLGMERFIAAGVSQGGASSLYAAMKYPDKIIAVIMLRTPTAWESRIQTRHNTKGMLERQRAEKPDDIYSYVIEGAMLSDFPPRDSIEAYASVKCPVLIMVCEDEVAHPASTANALHNLLLHSELHHASTRAEALREWPRIIEKFLNGVKIQQQLHLLES